ncbi:MULTISPECIES: DUF421 domain-containing protein [Pelosinus]|uniref:YetF C-terminal domain-containing protein n=1 Tax=Pelosinus fermentans B4 TaxID=1149862 RepID=I8RII2_9FIRM|nr:MULTISPECIES: DUF421 domain-containing protein [Pelosinus]EIW17830.1 protein of unknown function DUF421 [Pelosinus fermentans B4]EIW23792.1 protein of unknown function DUF421 [Pelosinus fermentans A11]OAM94715.1 protein of unknown function DUF421 [Pelosinus fermentans DSM 17108]SDR16029.1 Uncharacterized membrane protein YcaP, DUF421 family [Pelosinus fermentans]
MQTWIQILLSSVSLFFLMLILVRLMGKRNIVRMTPFRFVSYIVAAVIAAIMSLNLIANLTFGFIALSVWVLFPIALDYLSLKSKWIHDIVNGKETVLIKHGNIMEENLLQTRLTAEELLRELRSKNAFSLADVEFAVMEDTGDINVFMKSHKKPVSSYDLGMKLAPLTEPQTVILDGNMLNESLFSLGFNREWLEIQLETIGVSIDNVFIGQVDSSGDLYLDLFDDSIQIPQPKVKEMLYANFEKSQADLMSFSLETKNEAARKMYSEHAEKLEQLMGKLKPYLLR